MSGRSDTYFPADYFAARQEFRELAGRLEWARDAIALDAEGPGGEELTVDMARSVGDETKPLLVITSGLHGVEGPLGSAVQAALMRNLLAGELDRSPVQYLLIHALNPYGYAWSRRFDEQNIDPNRNFLLEEEAYSRENPMYRKFDALLNPQRPPSISDLFLLRAAWAILRNGKSNLKQAIAVGQYDWPLGLFYGGQAPCQTNQILREHLKSWVGMPGLIAHLDFHTGLGEWGTHKLLVDYPMMPEERERMGRWFGVDHFEEFDSCGVAYETSGGFGRWFRAQNHAAHYLYACAEFGTYNDVRVLMGLRTENQAHHWAEPQDPRRVRAKGRLRELFCPASPTWRRQVLDDSMRLVELAVRGLHGEKPPT